MVLTKPKANPCQYYIESGGGGMGGCAFDGAQIVLVPITDVAHLIHGPSGCACNSWNTRGSLSSGDMLYRQSFTTDLTENEIIYGGEEKLKKAIAYIAQHYTPAAIFVYLTCVTALIGEDIAHICRDMSRITNIPVIPVESPGFAGSKNFGNRLAGETLLKYVIGTREPNYTTTYDVNLIGEYNIAGELWGIKRILTQLGIRVLATITGDSSYRDIAASHHASLNIMVCSRALINIAEGMLKQYHIPFIEESFFGIRNTSQAIRDISRHLGIAEADRLIQDEERQVEEKIVPFKERLTGKRVVLYTGGVKSWSIISALSDLGMEVVACGTRKSTPEDIERMKEMLGKTAILLKDTGHKALVKVVRELNADIMVAGGRNQYTALKAKIPYLDINQEREYPYTGYEGMVNLAKMLYATLSSPVWELVRRPPLW